MVVHALPSPCQLACCKDFDEDDPPEPAKKVTIQGQVRQRAGFTLVSNLVFPKDPAVLKTLRRSKFGDVF